MHRLGAIHCCPRHRYGQSNDMLITVVETLGLCINFAIPAISNQSVNQNSRRPGVVGGYSDRSLRCDGRPRRLSSATRSSDDIDWPVHSLMFSFHDLRALPLQRLPSTEPCSMIFGSVSWRQTSPNHDNLLRLTVDSSSS